MNKNEADPVLVSYLLEKGGIVLPLTLMKHETVIELEKALRSGNSYKLSKFFEDFSYNLEKFFEIEKFGNFVKLVKDLKNDKNFYISIDDEKIIEFLVSIQKFRWDFLLETIGPCFFILRTLEDLNKSSLSENLQMFVFLSSYVMLYELVLHEIDRRLYLYLKSSKIKRDFEKFMRGVKRDDEKNHATAGIINKTLCRLIHIPHENNSIFGGRSEAKILRNKVAHTNIFYDEERKEIIISGKSYKKEDFLKTYFRLLSFLIIWIEKSLKVEVENYEIFISKMISDLRNYLWNLSRVFLKIERSGELKQKFVNIVIEWKKEAGLK